MFSLAIFKKRINRFVSIVTIKNKDIEVYTPNTGRLSELAIPGTKAIIVPSNGKYEYKLLYLYYNGFPIMIDSTYSNKLFKELLEKRIVKEITTYSLIRSEPAYKNHRFDYLIEDNRNEYFIELKSCTLAYKSVASFPDAISERASLHIDALADSNRGILIFFILHSNIKTFIPNYHTDFNFYKTLKEYYEKIKTLAFSITYDNSMRINSLTPVDILIPEIKPCGFAFLVYENNKTKDVVTNEKSLTLEKGYYIIIIENKDNIFKKIKQIRSKNKNTAEINYFSKNMKLLSDIPVVSETIELNDIIKGVRDFIFDENKQACFKGVRGFYAISNPLENKKFWDFIFKLRYGSYI